MQRRDALRLLVGSAVLPIVSRDALALFQEVHEPLPIKPALQTLNAHQDATVTALAEWIIPQTDTPGARAVRVNEFIDLILTEWCDDPERASFLAGLTSLDTACRDLFAKDFVDCSTAQQKQILTSIDEELTEARQADAQSPQRRGRRALPPADKTFFYTLKQLTLVGYFTSEEGAKQALHYEVIPSQHSECAPLQEEEASN
jgi:hypothetical protein